MVALLTIFPLGKLTILHTCAMIVLLFCLMPFLALQNLLKSMVATATLQADGVSQVANLATLKTEHSSSLVVRTPGHGTEQINLAHTINLLRILLLPI